MRNLQAILSFHGFFPFHLDFSFLSPSIYLFGVNALGKENIQSQSKKSPRDDFLLLWISSHREKQRFSSALWRAGLNFGNEFFFFNPPVLKPNSDLTLGQVGSRWNLSPLVLCDEFVGCIFFLQFLELYFCVRYPLLSTSTEWAPVMLVGHNIWNE